MKIIFTFLLLFLPLFATEQSKEICYTVQLVSKYNTQENKELFAKESYSSECKLMNIGAMLTVRCGCFKSKKNAIDLQQKYNKNIPNALVTTTYKYRFNSIKKSPNSDTSSENISKKTSPLKENNDIQKLNKKKKKVKKPKKKKKKHSKKHKKKKKSKKKKKKHKKKEKKTLKKEKSSLKEKPKKKKNYKWMKPRQHYYKYTKYLQAFKHERGRDPYDYRYEFGGQLSYDAGYINEAYSTYINRDFRRLRVYHKGSFFDKTLFYELEYSFKGDRFKDIQIGYKNSYDNFLYRVTLGNQKVPFSLESYSSSKYITFMERSLIDVFDSGRKLGTEFYLGYKRQNNYINLFALPFTNSIDENIANKVNQPGIALRVTYAYKFNKHHLFSLGTGYIYQNMQNKKVRFKQGSESKLVEKRYVSEKVKNVDIIRKNNLEFLYIYNNYALMAEYTKIEVDAFKDSYSFDGYYLEGSYFIYGDGKRYKFSNATLAKIKPYGYGAVEIALRYSKISLMSHGKSGLYPENGGTQSDINYGLNWYINNEFKASFNYIVAKPKKTDDYDGLLQIVQARLLFAF